jgi:hypothetical protein
MPVKITPSDTKNVDIDLECYLRASSVCWSWVYPKKLEMGRP